MRRQEERLDFLGRPWKRREARLPTRSLVRSEMDARRLETLARTEQPPFTSHVRWRVESRMGDEWRAVWGAKTRTAIEARIDLLLDEPPLSEGAALRLVFVGRRGRRRVACEWRVASENSSENWTRTK